MNNALQTIMTTTTATAGVIMATDLAIPTTRTTATIILTMVTCRDLRRAASEVAEAS